MIWFVNMSIGKFEMVPRAYRQVVPLHKCTFVMLKIGGRRQEEQRRSVGRGRVEQEGTWMFGLLRP